MPGSDERAGGVPERARTDPGTALAPSAGAPIEARAIGGAAPARRSPLVRRVLGGFVALVVVAGGVTAVAEGASRAGQRRAFVAALTGGDPARAPEEMIRYGCAGCHRIPGVPGARGRVGPSLAGFVNRPFIGGVLENTPENLVAWVRESRTIDSRTAMPNTGATIEAARDIAAYLYALRPD